MHISCHNGRLPCEPPSLSLEPMGLAETSLDSRVYSRRACRTLQCRWLSGRTTTTSWRFRPSTWRCSASAFSSSSSSSSSSPSSASPPGYVGQSRDAAAYTRSKHNKSMTSAATIQIYFGGRSRRRGRWLHCGRGHSPLPRIFFGFWTSKWQFVVHSWCNFLQFS